MLDNEVQPSKQALKFVASVFLSNNPDGMLDNEVQPKKQRLNTIACVLLSNNPAGMLDSEAQLLKQSPKLIACVFSNGVSILINFNALLLSALWLKVILGICCCVLSVCPDMMVRVYVPAAAYQW